MNGDAGDSGVLRSNSGDGLNAYPNPGDTWEFWWNTQTLQQQCSLYFAIQSSSGLSECFRICLNLGSTTAIEFEERGTNGSNYLDAGNGNATSDLSAKQFSPNTGTWYRTVVSGAYSSDQWKVWTDTGEGTTKLQSYHTDNTQYTNYGESGIAYYISGADHVYLDDIGIHSRGSNGGTGGLRTIDGFEDGTIDEYSLESDMIVSASGTAARSGDYGLDINGDDGNSGWIRSDSGLNTYPGPDDTWEIWWNPQTLSQLFRVNFAIQSSGSYDESFQITFGLGSTAKIEFEERGTNGDHYIDAGNGNATSDISAKKFSPNTGTWYRTVIDGSYSSDQWKVWTDTGEGTTKLQSYHTDNTQYDEYGGSGIAYYISGADQVFLDDLAVWTDGRQTGYIDTFEDDDLSEYSFDQGQSGAQVVSTPTYDGWGSLELSDVNTEMMSTSGLRAYPEQGDTFSYWVRATDGAQSVNLAYGVQDYDNRYMIQVDFVQGELILCRDNDGTETNIDADWDVTLDEDTWYEVEVAWETNGTHTVTLRDWQHAQLSQITGSDSTWSNGGIGFNGYNESTGGTFYIDQVAHNGTITGIYVDDFEDGSLQEYDFGYGDSAASICSSPVQSGERALKFEGVHSRMYSTSGLSYYPSAGDVISYAVRTEGGAEDADFMYGVQDDQNYYAVRLDVPNKDLDILKITDDSLEVLANGEPGSTIDFDEDTWYRVEIDWTTIGDHTARLYDEINTVLCEVSAADATWKDGGIGYNFRADQGSIYYDSIAAAVSPYPVTLTLENQTSSSVSYTASVTGEMHDLATASAGTTDSDSIPAEESVGYMHSGDLKSIDDGNCKVDIDHSTKQITVTDLAGTSPEYSITVNGSISAADSNNGATIDGKTASGSVVDGQDTFDFTDDVTEVSFPASFRATTETKYPCVTGSNAYPDATVRQMAAEAVEDPNNDRVLFTTHHIEGSPGLYLARGVNSLDEVPDEIQRLTTSTFGTYNLKWHAEDELQFWKDGIVFRQTMSYRNIIKRPEVQSYMSVDSSISGGDE